MTEPDERPGSDDPEDPSELQRLIGRTVPRSPHAGTRRAVVADEAPGPDPGPADDPVAPSADERSPDVSPVDAARADEAPVDVPHADEARTDRAQSGEVPAEANPAGGTPVDEPPIAGAAAGTAPTGDVPRGTLVDAGAPKVPLGAASAGAGVDEPGVDEPGVDEPGADEDQVDPVDELAEDTDLEHALEALLLVVDSPVDEASLAATLEQPTSRIRATLHRMAVAYTADARGIDLRRAGGGWRFYTRDRYAPYVEKMLLDGQRARLTRAALETLAVVAYRQPVTRARVSAVRGVNCDGVLRTLLTRGLVEEAGAEEQTGGTLFRTTELFLERLGLSSVAELPPLAPLLPDIDAIDDLDGS